MQKVIQLVSGWQSLNMKLGLSQSKAKPRTGNCKLLGSFGREWGHEQSNRKTSMCKSLRSRREVHIWRTRQVH